MTQYVSHILPNNIHLSISELSWWVQGYVNVCVCCNAGLGLSHETELYQATTHSSSRPPALNAPADLSCLPTLHEHQRENERERQRAVNAFIQSAEEGNMQKSGNNKE